MDRRRIFLLVLVLLVLVVVVILTNSRQQSEISEFQTSELPSSSVRDKGQKAQGYQSQIQFASVKGNVIDQQGQVVASAWVCIAPPHREDWLLGQRVPIVPKRVSSSPQGEFFFEALIPGVYQITAMAVAYGVSPGVAIHLQAGQNIEDIRLVLGRQGYAISGTVKDAGGGVLAYPSLAAESERSRATYSTEGDTQGKFSIFVSRGAHKVTASSDGYASQTKMVDVSVDQQVDFRLSPAAAIQGKVVSASTGQATAGATVNLVKFQPQSTTKTDPSGRFEFNDVAPGSYHINASYQGQIGLLSAPVDIGPGESVRGLEILISEGRTLAGRVVYHDQSPAVSETVAVIATGFGHKLLATTDRNGAFRYQGLLPMRYRVSVRRAGDLAFMVDNKTMVDLSHRDVVDLLLTVEKGALVRGRVIFEDGRPVPQAIVKAVSFKKTVSNDQGQFQFENLPLKAISFCASHSSGGGACSKKVKLRSGKENPSVLITLLAGFSVSGTVKWDNGQPAASINVTASCSNEHKIGTRTDENGHFTLEPLGAGANTISAHREAGQPGYFDDPKGGASQKIRLSKSNRQAVVNLIISSKTHEIQGVVLTPEGQPVGGAKVEVQIKRPGELSSKTIRDTYSLNNGTFRITGLQKEAVLLKASIMGFAPSELLPTPVDRQVELRLQHAGILSGTVVTADGRPVTTYVLTVLNKKSTLGIFGLNYQVHHPSGAFEVGGLAADKYRLVVAQGPHPIGYINNVVLTPGARVNGITITTREPCKIVGVLINAKTKQAIRGANLFFVSTNDPQLTKSDANGSFELSGGLPGPQYHLLISAKGYEPYEPVIQFSEEETIRDLGTILMKPKS